MIRARIVGTGSYLPEKILSNHDLEKMVDTTDEWIRTRTGISERRIAEKGTNTSDLALISSPHPLAPPLNPKPPHIYPLLPAAKASRNWLGLALKEGSSGGRFSLRNLGKGPSQVAQFHLVGSKGQRSCIFSSRKRLRRSRTSVGIWFW